MADRNDDREIFVNSEEKYESVLRDRGVSKIFNPPTETGEQTSSYASIGLGAQILNDLGIGKIELLGAPLKYNALAGFGLEVVDFIAASG